MNIHKATSQYEQWLTSYTALVAKDIAYKHEQMALGVFPFLRATFFGTFSGTFSPVPSSHAQLCQPG